MLLRQKNATDCAGIIIIIINIVMKRNEKRKKLLSGIHQEQLEHLLCALFVKSTILLTAVEQLTADTLMELANVMHSCNICLFPPSLQPYGEISLVASRAS